MSIAAAAGAAAALPLVGDLIKTALPVVGDIVKAVTPLLQPFADGAAKKIFGDDPAEEASTAKLTFEAPESTKITYNPA